MHKIFFWNHWDLANRRYYQILVSILAIIICYLLWMVYVTPDQVYDWWISNSLNDVQTPFPLLPEYFTNQNLTLDLKLITQNFIGSDAVLQPISTYVFLGSFVFGILICLTVTTYLSRFWYIVSVGLVVLLLATMGLDKLGVFGFYDRIPIIACAIPYILLSYYFNTFRADIDIKRRFFSFLGLTIVFALVINYYSDVSTPFLYLANFSFLPTIVITIVFVFLIAHEVIYFILLIATQDTSGLSKKNTAHFLILSTIYLLNVLLVYLRNRGYLDWNVYYINPFVLLILSSILGFWGIKGREVLYKNILPFYPYVGYLYVGLAIIALGTISFHFTQVSDATLETVEDAIVFGHIGFGLMFFLYIIVNFISLLLKNLPVYKIAFKEDNFPYFTARLAGLIVVAGFYFLSNQVARRQAISGYYSGVADIYYQNGDVATSKIYYKEASVYGYQDHKSNYMLGKLEEKPIRKTLAFKRATGKNPTEYAFINLGVEYTNDNKYFDAVFAYQAGLKEFPESVAIQSNLALLYSETDANDSTLHYLDYPYGSSDVDQIRLSNAIQVCAKKGLDYKKLRGVDSAMSISRYDIGAHILACAVQAEDYGDIPLIPMMPDPVVNAHSFAYLNNLGIWSYKGHQKNYLDQIDQFLEHAEMNSEYREQLLFLKALNMYQFGELSHAFDLLNTLSSSGGRRAGYYSYIAGLWSLRIHQFHLAIDYFEDAVVKGYTQGQTLKPLMEHLKRVNSSDTNQVLPVATADSSLVQEVRQLTLTVNQTSDQIITQTDDQKLFWILANSAKASMENMTRVSQAIKDSTLQQRAREYMLLRKFGEQGGDPIASGDVETAYAMTAHSTEGVYKLLNVVNEVKLINLYDGKASLGQAAGLNDLGLFKQVVSGEMLETQRVVDLGKKNAFAEAYVMSAVGYLKEVRQDDERAYEILLHAIGINKYSETLIKAYIDQCFDMGLTSYAESTLLRLIDILAPEEYNAYEKWFDIQKERVEADDGEW